MAKEIEDLREKLGNRLVAKHYVYTVVADAILGSTNRFIPNDSHPMTALLLGLGSYGKANLRRHLTKLLDDENNGTAKFLFQINSSQCSNYDEFFNLMYELFYSIVNVTDMFGSIVICLVVQDTTCKHDT